jgi:hypothetical protein
MQHQPGETAFMLEAVEREFVGRDGSEASERNMESVAMKQCDTGEGEGEQDEFDWYTER